MIKNTKNYKVNLLGNKVDIDYTKNFLNTVNISSLVRDSYDRRTVFNYALINFHYLFNNYNFDQDKNNLKNVSIPSSSSEIDKAFSVVKKYANSFEEINFDFANEVLSSYKKIYEIIDEEFHWSKKDFFVVPLKGGGYIMKLFDFKNKKILPIEAKRVPLKQNGKIALGMNIENIDFEEINSFYNSINTDDEIVFLEVCVASGMTTIGFLLDMYSKKTLPKKVIVVTAAASVQGIQLVQEIAEQLGIKVEFKTAKIFNKLANFFNTSQDSVLYNDGKFVVKSPEKAFLKVKLN